MVYQKYSIIVKKLKKKFIKLTIHLKLLSHSSISIISFTATTQQNLAIFLPKMSSITFSNNKMFKNKKQQKKQKMSFDKFLSKIQNKKKENFDKIAAPEYWQNICSFLENKDILNLYTSFRDMKSLVSISLEMRLEERRELLCNMSIMATMFVKNNILYITGQIWQYNDEDQDDENDDRIYNIKSMVKHNIKYSKEPKIKGNFSLLKNGECKNILNNICAFLEPKTLGRLSQISNEFHILAFPYLEELKTISFNKYYDAEVVCIETDERKIEYRLEINNYEDLIKQAREIWEEVGEYEDDDDYYDYDDDYEGDRCDGCRSRFCRGNC